MSYNSLNDITNFYRKNLSDFNLYNKSEKRFLLFPAFAFIVWVHEIFTNPDFSHKPAFWVAYLSSLLLIFLFNEKVRRRIIKESKIDEKNTKLNTCLYIYRRDVFIKELQGKFKIKTEKQKEILIEMLKGQIGQPYDIKNLWIVGLSGALILPIWNALVEKSFATDFETFKNNLSAITSIIFTVLFFAGAIHFTIVSHLLDFLNKKNLRYKQMILILQEDLLLKHYNKESSPLSGEITLTRIK